MTPYRAGLPMRACLWEGPGLPLRVEEVTAPGVCEPHDVVLRVRTAMFGAALVRAALVGHPKLVPPKILGSLLVGEVVAAGDEVRHLTPGHRAVVDPHPPCGRCVSCAQGNARVCGDGARVEPGALAEFVRVTGDTERAVRPVPDGVEDLAAIFTEPLACAVGAVADGGVGPKDRVLVVGSGQLAFLLAQAACAAGAASVTCTVRNDARRSVLRSAGIPTVPAPHKGPAEGGPYSVVFEAVGRPETYATALVSVAPGGTVVAFGGCPPGTRVGLDVNRLHYACVRLVGSYHYPPGGFDQALGLIAGGVVDTSMLQRHVLPLNEIARAPEVARHGDVLALLVSP